MIRTLSSAAVRLLLFVPVAVLLSSGAPSVGRGAPRWPPAAFTIGMWCGPPEPYITTAQYRHIADAGFTMVMPPCEPAAAGTVARNRKILDTARATGLKAMVIDSRMPFSVTGNPEAIDNLKGIVKDYKRHPALFGCFIRDEPGVKAFAGLAEVVAELKRLDPNHPAFINLFPNYATTDLNETPSQLETDTYDRYLSLYLQTVKPYMLSWDHYFFLEGGDRPGFLGNLYAVQSAVSGGQPPTPFWQIVQSVQLGPYRALTEAELRYQAMQTLVFGGSGLSYFTYWLTDDPSFHWSNGIRNRDGTPGPLYEPVKHVNAEVKTLAKYLYGTQVIATFQSGTLPPDGRANAGDLPLRVTSQSDLSVGFFRAGSGYSYVLATNRDYKSAVHARISFDAAGHGLEVLDLATNKWKKMGKPGIDGRTEIGLDLPAAGAALVRWR